MCKNTEKNDFQSQEMHSYVRKRPKIKNKTISENPNKIYLKLI